METVSYSSPDPYHGRTSARLTARGGAYQFELHDRVREDVVRSAERMPTEHFDFQPIPDVRTFGQLVGHVATNLYGMCAAASAERNPHPALVEETTAGKVDLMDALKAAYDYCEEALASLNDVNGLDRVTTPREGTRLSFLVDAIQHTSLHYGNMVTYMRLKGLVPASTDRGDVIPTVPVQDQQPPVNSPPLMRRLVTASRPKTIDHCALFEPTSCKRRHRDMSASRAGIGG